MHVLHFIDLTISPTEILELPFAHPDALFLLPIFEVQLKVNCKDMNSQV